MAFKTSFSLHPAMSLSCITRIAMLMADPPCVIVKFCGFPKELCKRWTLKTQVLNLPLPNLFLFTVNTHKQQKIARFGKQTQEMCFRICATESKWNTRGRMSERKKSVKIKGKKPSYFWNYFSCGIAVCMFSANSKSKDKLSNHWKHLYFQSVCSK